MHPCRECGEHAKSKKEMAASNESAQLAKPCAGGILCLHITAAVHTHVPGWTNVPAVKFGLKDLQTAKPEKQWANFGTCL